MCHLQELYAKYQDRGLVVLGFNCSDDRQIALDMLSADNVTFPNIIDASEAAVTVCFQKYQGKWGSAVPLSYLIDTEGKVVDAWYGYPKGHPNVKAFLAKMGIHDESSEQ